MKPIHILACLVLLSAPQSSVDAAETQLCKAIIKSSDPIKYGYLEEISALDPTLDHTIKDKVGFATDNLGKETVQSMRNGDAKAFIYVGDGRDAYWNAVADGWKIGERVEKREGFHLVYRATRSDESAFLVFRVNGNDRVAHIQSLFRLIDTQPEKLATLGHVKRWKKEYLDAFHSTGKKPDLVLYGMAMRSVGTILEMNPVRNLGKIIDLRRNLNARSSVPDLRVDRDLDGIQMHQFEMTNGKTIWIFNNLYGDLSDDLLEALTDFGVSRLSYIGTAGALTSKYHVGDVVTPNRWLKKGERVARKVPGNYSAAFDARVATYAHVSAPAIETMAWLEKQAAAGVDVVEVELSYWLARLEKHPEIQFTSTLIVSDVMSGPNHTDLTEWGKKSSSLARNTILNSLKFHLQLHNTEDLRVSHYDKIPILGIAR